jgi:hypothetical protein
MKPTPAEMENERMWQLLEMIDKSTGERDELKRWKEEMLQVESEWDCQRVGELLNIGLGEPMRKNIEPKIREILKAIQNFRDVEGRYHTQIAIRRLFKFLPIEKL